ncbi:DEAD/DEAH box helicase [Neomoorella humiferrea]|uniref:DEAD/DEAH box helicase n=1 Tax=Neomoorella humiferrea TaxID=676965 RepID=UPI003D8A89C1
MGLDPLRTTEAVVGKYLDYLETTFAFKDIDLRRQLAEELSKEGKFAKGPILEAIPPFKTGCSIDELIEQGVLSPEFRKLQTPALPLERPLYLHQEIAIRKLVENRRNIIIATGTGSGKTETFLVPILNYLFRQQEKGILGPGVRALLLYPMNALANDQLKRLRTLLKNYPAITFGSYTGETERDERKAIEQFRRMNPREDLLPNQLLSREQMQATPPHILLTNYAMLEYLLLRPQDNVFFDGEYARDWRFIVIDEVHTYSGAKGIEMAMLLRRLKDRVCESRPGTLQCIGTSATLGVDEKGFREVTEFGTKLFGEKFEWIEDNPARQDVVVAFKKHLKVAESSWGKPGSELYGKWSEVIDGDEQDKIERLIAGGLESGIPQNILTLAQKDCRGEWSRFIYLVLSRDSRVITLQQRLEQGPCFLQDVARELFPGVQDGQNRLVALVYLANKARLEPGSQSLLPARYHLFIRALEGAYVSLLPEKRLYLERREQIKGADGRMFPVFEAATCRQCDALYLVGEVVRGGEHDILKQPGRRFYEDNNNLVYFLLLDDKTPVPENEDEIVASGEDIPPGEEYLLCGGCGAVRPKTDAATPCSCGEKSLFLVIKVSAKNGNVYKCPACGSINSLGSVVRRFVLGAEAVTSVLATALYQQIPEQVEVMQDDDTETDDWEVPDNISFHKSNRRLLIFSDSRQDAAYFSTYLQASYNQILQRRLIIMTLEKYKSQMVANEWRVNDLANFVKRMLYDLQLFPQMSMQQLEIEAWKWVLHEFIVSDRIIGLEGLGLVGFKPVLPPGWNPPRALCKEPWNFTVAEATDLIMVLLDTVRKSGAVRFPDVVDPRDPFFAPRNKEFYFKENMSYPGRVYSWTPTRKGGNNSRMDYLLRLAAVQGGIEREKVEELLVQIWNRLLTGERAPWKGHFSSHHESQGLGEVYCLKPEYWRVLPAIVDDTITWYRCSRCRRLTLYNIKGVCPTYRCDGQLVACNPAQELAGNHYRKLYLDILPLVMQTSEHTAQLTTERAAEIQQKFNDGQINVLSCSTTFELGVDVGELETVFMRNVPPSATNYIQRAGRAGRRTDSTAFALTFAQRHSHDFAHYNEPLRIIKGEIRPPHIEISNDKIIKRHMYAVALAMFWKLRPEYFGQVKTFFPESGETASQALGKLLRDKPGELQKSLSRIIPNEILERLGVHDWSWLDGLLDETDGVLSKAEEKVMADLRELKAIEAEYSRTKNHLKAQAVHKTINTIEKRYILDFLAQQNVIPKYGFPVDVVELQIYHHGEEARGLELDRDLKVALSEYAPGSQVIAGGKLWTSKYIKKLPDRNPVEYAYAICDYCGYYQSDIAEKNTPMDNCICGNKIGNNRGIFIVPEFGFIAGPPETPTMTKPQKTYTTRKFFAQEENIEQKITLTLNGFKLNLQAGSGRLAVINSAGKRGFKICQSCGYAEVNTGEPLGPHETLWGIKCNGRAARYSLGYEFYTDVLRIWFPEYHDQREGFWESVLYGILEGACSALDIERQDVDGTLYPYAGNPYSPALVLFDDVPGGAGHVKRIAEKDNLMRTLQRTLAILSRCECGGSLANTSCYGCLRNYTNQYCHDKLNRGYVIEFIKKLLSSSPSV